ncbi:bifunctional aminoacyl-tRNA synthetase [Verticillium alfalfae VaMs.102]|uniref:proline--tRNA ligase n=1 Tax=Verticillium alfalfae (strain VaMs.102 / ATCC MYA-4576 / FGSC 10136) TaxID=526221 RepID=C9S5L5_VERA1|nr:bifunctional aminoacyl-tRNA synthetase [Verticillium alfalfae VaMs.102]EEY15079.1 bifunctional aminoacyl-tRNA synthetase [Verticillium alfalfae VaMs.102]
MADSEQKPQEQQAQAAQGDQPAAPAGPSKSALKKAEKQAKMAADKAAKAAKQASLPVVGGKKTDDIIGITVSKSEDFSAWYQEVVLKAEMVEYYNEIAGFFILRPASMYIWSAIRKWFSDKIELMGVEETSFPIFLSSKSLEKEKDHVEGFAPELAWVTKAGDKDLEVPVAVRPTSEAVMYPYYSKWIRSHRDLPLRLNQWNSVVRWEAKQTTPFLRTREFLWQEGHTAHLTEELAGKEVLEILELYAGVYEQLLAVPVVRGTKTENEKFAGGFYTTTVEGYIPSNGRGIQGATSHCLGQNFSKMFDITVEDPVNKGNHIHVWQNSWGLSTRVIGVMVMIHGDDKGLVLPPRIAKIQAIVIPVGITAKLAAEDRKKLEEGVEDIRHPLKKAGVRTESDHRCYTPAWSSTTGAARSPELLETIQSDLYTKAEKSFREHRLKLTNWDEVVPALDAKNVVIIPFCLDGKCEDRIKEMTTNSSPENEALPEGKRAPTMGMKSLCIPFEQPEGLVEGETKCLNPECSSHAKKWVMFGRSY